MKIVGRVEEQRLLESCYASNKPEFIVVYGRRRVGKTFLIRETFQGRFCFRFTGYANVTRERQLFRFNTALREFSGKDYPQAKDWFVAFDQLRSLIEESQIGGRKVVFLDEMPWMDNRKSDFLSALEGFWNGWASGREDILLIVCGSAASWIVGKLFGNKGGLHNRVTRRIHIEPFSLKECEDFLRSRGFVYDRRMVLESYMVFGGIPYYMDLLEKEYSVSQNVDRLCFSQNGALVNEFSDAFASIFEKPGLYMEIVSALAQKASGMNRYEIVEKTDCSNGGTLTRVLDDLERCGFVRKFSEYGKRSKGAVFQLIDLFSLFYLKQMQGRISLGGSNWTNALRSGERNAWNGYAFEIVCFWHIPQIKKRLGISGVSTVVYTWRSRNAVPGAQIDMVIDRMDGIVNLCEMKYSNQRFPIDHKYAERLAEKAAAFAQETGLRKALHTTFVTVCGLAESGYRHSAQSEVTLDDLFE